MSVIITMAGFGKRFLEAGYEQPKYKIMAKGRTLFSWALLSLRDIKQDMTFVFIVRAADQAKEFIKEECGTLGIGKLNILELDAPTDGQATTAYLGLEACHPNEPLWIYNIDTYVEPEYIPLPPKGAQGYIPCFQAPGSHWSFVQADDQGKALQVREKERISDLATIGLYWFNNIETYKKAYEATYPSSRNRAQGEFYIAPMYQEMIRRDQEIRISVIPSRRVHAIGTPDELSAFLKS